MASAIDVKLTVARDAPAPMVRSALVTLLVPVQDSVPSTTPR